MGIPNSPNDSSKPPDLDIPSGNQNSNNNTSYRNNNNNSTHRYSSSSWHPAPASNRLGSPISPPHSPSRPASPVPLSFKRRTSSRPSLIDRLRRVSSSILPSSYQRLQNQEDVFTDTRSPRSPSFAASFKPPIPHALPAIHNEPYSTPLPIIPITVLAICMMSEFLSASVTSPFIYFMIEDFGVGKGSDGGGEAAVGFWSGIVGSCFFLSQFLTSLLWASASEKHGRRAVLFTSLLGNACTLVAFGATRNLPQAICVRLGQGLFNGAIGVARGAIRDITDPTNEGRAYSVVGLAWALGGTVGPIAGGILEHPVENHPYFFGNNTLFKTYPYLLPCMAAASFISIGAFLSLFLNRDGGSRSGGIYLHPEKDNESTIEAGQQGPGSLAGRTTRSSSIASSPHRLTNKLSRVFSNRDRNGSFSARSSFSRIPSFIPITQQPNDAPNRTGLSVNERNPLTNQISSTPYSGGITGYGSAYGYDNQNHQQRPHPPPPPSLSAASAGGGAQSYLSTRSLSRYPHSYYHQRNRAASRVSDAPSTQYAPDFEDEHERMRSLSFAQRLLLSNEDAVFSISDVWVAAATRDEDNYSMANWDENDYHRRDDRDDRSDNDDNDDDDDGTGSVIEHSIDENEDAITVESTANSDSEMNDDRSQLDFDENSHTPSAQPSMEEIRRHAQQQQQQQQAALQNRQLNSPSPTKQIQNTNSTTTNDQEQQQTPRHRLSSRRGSQLSEFSQRLRSKNIREMRSASLAGSVGNYPKSRRRSSGSSRLGGPFGGATYERPLPAAYRNTGLAAPVRRESESYERSYPMTPPRPTNLALPESEQAVEAPTSLPVIPEAMPSTSTSQQPQQPQQQGQQPQEHYIVDSSAASKRVPSGESGHTGTSATETIAQNDPQAQPEGFDDKQQQASTWSQLPVAFILQHALLAFHGTTMDQVFMSFLVTPVGSGGLGLTAVHYAELVAVMCVCNMFFQFRFYPTVGPPRGNLSHLSMFRLGLFIYLPVYMLFPGLRQLGGGGAEGGNGFVMTGMVLLSAFRYLANVCSYSSIMILTNAMTAPHLVPLANGLAQTAVSAARFAGPVLGGFVWSYSISDGVDARAYPFNYAFGFCVIACICTTGLLLSLHIR